MKVDDRLRSRVLGALSAEGFQATAN
jgi:hypothetical protein